MDLTDIRKEIDTIDEQMVQLFCQRILHPGLNGAPQRAGSIDRAEADFGQKRGNRLIQGIGVTKGL